LKKRLFLICVFWALHCSVEARLGETIEELTKRYGPAEKVYDEEYGITIVKYQKEGLEFKFDLIDFKAEGVHITGKINDKEAEVFMARNVPPGTSFQLVENPETPYRHHFDFWKSYAFSDKTSAHFCRPKQFNEGYSELVIETEKMQAFQKWKREKEEQKKLADANSKADRIESAKAPIEEVDASPPPEIFREKSAVSGGAQMGQDASFASMATALGRYKHKLYLAIGSRWNFKVQQAITNIEGERVVMRFHVNPDGSISDLAFKMGNPNSKLALISSEAVQQTCGLVGPFPSELLGDKPHGFDWSLAFRIK